MPVELVRVEVVGVLVGDQYRLGAVQGLLLAERAGIDHERPVVLLQPDQGMGELHDAHGAESRASVPVEPVKRTVLATWNVSH
ncbi:hypothetical protein GCM10023317_68940 [Actinopolymorpha pittospori]